MAWSIWKPVWSAALFVQLRLIWLEEAVVAVRPLGAAGAQLLAPKPSDRH